MDETAFKRALGRRIRALRENRDMTQRRLGDYVGVGNSQISHWESGTQSPDSVYLPRLLRALRCSITDLYPGGEQGWEESLVELPTDPATKGDVVLILREIQTLAERVQSLAESELRADIERAVAAQNDSQGKAPQNARASRENGG